MTLPVGKSLTGPRVERMHTGAFEALGLPSASPVFPTRIAAEAWLRAELPKLPRTRQPRVRPCLRCSRDFHSEGAHNRLCPHCRRQSDDALGNPQRPVITSRKA